MATDTEYGAMLAEKERLELQLSELKEKYKLVDAARLALQDADAKAYESDRLLGEAVTLLRESRQYAGVDWMVKTDNFLNKTETRNHEVCKVCGQVHEPVCPFV